MKLSLMVLTSGKSEGQTIPIKVPEFVIGRDAACHLRPASAMISKRHCAIQVRGSKVFVLDFESTNGTFVNDEPVRGERELQDKDQLKVGPLAFQVSVVLAPPTAKPRPSTKPLAEPSEDDSAAAMLLSLGDDDSSSDMLTGVDEAGIPTGSTVMEALTTEGAAAAAAASGKPEPAKPAKSAGTGDTSSAAKAILDRYIKRPRV